MNAVFASARRGAAVAALAAAALPAPALAAPCSIDRVDGALSLTLRDADRRQAIGCLAAATGSTVFGADRLPPTLGRLTLKATGIAPATAWRLVLDNAPVGFALACDARACEVWFASVSAPVPVQTAARATPERRRVESSEEGN